MAAYSLTGDIQQRPYVPGQRDTKIDRWMTHERAKGESIFDWKYEETL